MIVLLVLSVSLIVFLFCLFLLSRDNFLLFRKNVDLETMVNVGLLSLTGGLFFSRLFYALFIFKADYLNILVFLLFSKFGSLSLIGGIIGASVVLWFLGRRAKMPIGHIFDIFALCFLSGYVIGGGIHLMFDFRKQSIVPLLAMLGVSFLLILLLSRLIKTQKFREGSVYWLFLFIFSFANLGEHAIFKQFQMPYFLKENILISIVIVISLFLLIKNQRIFSRR